MNIRNSHRFSWMTALILILMTTSYAHAITTFTVNGQAEFEFHFEDWQQLPDKTSLRFEADVSQPGGTLVFELYIDANGDGQLDPQIDVKLPYPQTLKSVDGGFGFPGDQDGTANSQITFEAELADLLPGFPTSTVFIRAVDEDDSSATIVLHPIPPELIQSISGRISSEDGEPIGGVIVLAYPQPEGPIPRFESSETPPQIRPDFLTIPLFTVTDADGNYHLPTEAGQVTVRVVPKPGYYVREQGGFPNPFDFTGQKTVTVGPAENRTGVDFTLAVDGNPPTIEHEPPQEAVIINSTVRLRARITDPESGVNPYGFDGFTSWGGMPTVFFRPAGTNLPFRTRMMYPSGGVLPLSGQDHPEPDGVDAGGAEPPIPLPGIDLPGLPIDFPQLDTYEAFLSGSDIGAEGLEYYIRASDRAGNSTTDPGDAPATVYHIPVKASDYIISGRIHTPDDGNVAEVTVFANTFTYDRGGIDSAQTTSTADGTYALHLPAAGSWTVSIVPPRQFVVSQPNPPRIMVEVVQPGVYDGNDFIVVEDLEPPVINHDPTQDVTASFIGEDVFIRATIHDNSGTVYANLVMSSAEGADEKFIPYAIPSVENETDWTFRIPGDLVQSDFAYFIEAYDQVGNRATHPQNPENPHRVTLLPSPYQIVGAVTDADGNPVSGVRIILNSESSGPSGEEIRPIPEIRFRYVETGADGQFSVSVTPGVWNVRAVLRGFVPPEAIDPIRVEAEGDYPLQIVLIADSEPPMIVHQPAAGYTFGEPMIVQAQVTDNHQVRLVALQLFHEFNDRVVTFNPAEDGAERQGAENGNMGDADAPPPAPDGGEGQVEPSFPVIVRPPFPPDVDFPPPLEPTQPGYFEYIPMETTDGVNYSVDLRDHLYGPFDPETAAISYVIQAVDAAGVGSISPENPQIESDGAPVSVETMHTVTLTLPQTIAGTVTVDGEPLAGATIYLTDEQTVKLFTQTDAEGHYLLPAVVGRNIVSTGFGFGYEVEFPTDRFYEVEVEADQHVDGIDFRLKPGQFVPPILESGTGRTMEDVNADAFINIFDLVLVGSNFGKKILSDSAAATLSPNPDVNGDNVVNIFDLVLVANRFGEKLSENAPSPLMQTVNAQVNALPLERGRSTAKIALSLETDVEVSGMQFDIALHSDGAKLIAVEKGDVLDADAQRSFWRKPDLRGNVARGAANVALRSADAKTGAALNAGQIAIVTLQLDAVHFGDNVELYVDNLLLVAPDGQGVLARTQPIQLNAETLLLPDRDLLLQNYPNPFNPETWIPYQLTEASPVTLTIHDASGAAVRTISVGYQNAGFYQSKEEAIYWNGRNDSGEPVASGIYFYTLSTHNFTETRKMILVK